MIAWATRYGTSDPIRHASHKTEFDTMTKMLTAKAVCGVKLKRRLYGQGGRLIIFDPEHPKTCRECAAGIEPDPRLPTMRDPA